MSEENIMVSFAKMQAEETLKSYQKILTRISSNGEIVDLTCDSFKDFCKKTGDALIFFLDNPTKRPEAMDLAVLIPDLLAIGKASKQAVSGGFLREADSRKLMASFGINQLPTILFLRDGDYVGVISGLKNWNEYQEQITQMINKSISKAPTIGIAVNTIN